MLQRVLAFTVTTPALDDMVRAYTRFLGFGVVHRSVITPTLARHWQAPATAGCRQVLLSPGGSDSTYLRVVETAVPHGYRTYRSQGWLAAELLVEDVDALAATLVDSAFSIVRPPANLSFSDNIRAMQVRGPGNEIIYLTQFKGPVPGMRTPVARHRVDRPFIMVLGGATMASLQQWYCDFLGAPRTAIMPVVISAMSAALDAPLDTRYDIAAVTLPGDCWLELDVMPEGTPLRDALPGSLPAGIGMASFEVDVLPDTSPGAPPATVLEGPPYYGRRAAVLHGPAGERVELVAAAAPPAGG